MALFLLRLSPESLLLLTFLLNKEVRNPCQQNQGMKAQSATKELRIQGPALLRRELGAAPQVSS